MYIVRHGTTWAHWDLGPCAPILQYGPWAQPLHPKIEPKTYQGYGPRSHITMFCPKPIWHTIVILSHRNMQLRDCPVTHILDKNVIARKHHISNARYCLRLYHRHTGLLMWEPIPRPLPPKYPLTINDIGPPVALTSRAIIIFPLILGYKQRKRKKKRAFESFPSSFIESLCQE